MDRPHSADRPSPTAPDYSPRAWEWIPAFAVLIVPLAFIPYPGNPEFSALKIWLIEIFAIAGVGLWIRSGTVFPSRSHVFFLAFFLLCTVSLVPAVNRFLTLSHLGLLAGLIILSVLCLNLSQGGILRLVHFAVLSGLAVSVLGIAQSAGILLPPRLDIFGESMYPSTFRHANYAAQFVSPVILITLGLLLLPTSGKKKILLIAAGACEIIFLFITRSRAGLLTTAAGIILLLGFWVSFRLRSRTGGSRRLLPAAAAACGAVIALVAAVLLFPPARKGVHHLRTAFDLHQPSTRVRVYLYFDTVKMIAAHPFTGVGLGNYPIVLPDYWSDELKQLITSGKSRSAENAHNDFLSLAAEAGLPALLTFLFLIGSMLVNSLREYRRDQDFVRIISLAALTTLLLYALIDYPLRNPASSLLFWLLLGGSARKPASPIPGPFSRICSARIPSGVFLAALSLFLLLLGWLATRPLIANHFWHRGLAAYVQSPPAAERDLARALSFSPHHPKILFLLGNISTLSNDIPRAIRYYEEAVRIAPHDSKTWFNLAELYLEEKRLAEALPAVRKVLALDPRHPGAHYRWAIFLALKGNTYTSARELEKAIRLDGRFRQIARNEPIFREFRERPEFQEILTPPQSRLNP